MTNDEKYELYYSILKRYNLAQFDEAINCTPFLCCVNKDFYNDFEDIERTVFDCMKELNKHTDKFEDFFVVYRDFIDDEYNDTITLVSVKTLHELLHDDKYI